MVGASYAHVTISGNLVHISAGLLWEQPFVPLPIATKIRVPDGSYFYPDASVSSEPPKFEDDRSEIVVNPLVVVGVTSRSTESFDRGRKLDDYRRIPSLRDDLIVDRFEPHIDHHHRDGDQWRSRTVRGLVESVVLTAFDAELPLADVYHRILPTSND